LFRGATLYSCEDLPSRSILSDKITNKRVPNNIIDKNTRRERNLPSRLRDVTTYHRRIIGVIDYYFQARVSRQVDYADIFSTNVFILSPSDNILVILAKSNDASNVKNIITKVIDDTQSEVQYFTLLEITTDQMRELAMRVRNSHENNWCDRPRFSHEAGRYHGHVFHDYSNGVGECVLDSAEFEDEFPNATGLSPIIKYFQCENLDPIESARPKTMRFKHEGQISTSASYNFEHWDYFLFDLVLPIIRG